MSSKSLIIFVSVGVIAGLVLGLYLIDLKTSSQLSYVEGPGLSIVTDKLDFKKGEEITIYIINSGTVPVNFSDSTYGLEITGLSGVLIYKPETDQDLDFNNYALESKEEVVFVWNQIKNDGDSAHEGLYKIKSIGFDPEDNKIEKTTTITIWK